MGHRRIRARLAAMPAALAAAARSAPSGAPGPGEWTPADIVRHLIAVELEVWHVRLGQLATEGHPHWTWAEPDRWSGRPDATLDDLLAVHRVARQATIGLLDALGPGGWGRRGTHETFGILDVEALMVVAADHDDEHLRSLADRGRTPRVEPSA